MSVTKTRVYAVFRKLTELRRSDFSAEKYATADTLVFVEML